MTTSLQLACKGKYIELRNFKMEVTNIFLSRHYDIKEEERVSIIKHLANKGG